MLQQDGIYTEHSFIYQFYGWNKEETADWSGFATFAENLHERWKKWKE